MDRWRPPATMVSTHAFAAALAMVMLMAFGAIAYARRHRMAQIAMVMALPLMGTALMVTAVRNAVGSAVIGVATLLLIRRRLGLAVLVAIAGGLAVYQVDAMTGGDAVERIGSIVRNPANTVGRVRGPWNKALGFALENPLGGGIGSGVATGRTGYTTRQFDPENQLPFIENDYGRALLELGFPGLVLYLWMLFTVIRTSYRAYSRASTERDRWLLGGLFAACISILARLFVGAALYGWPEAPIFWCFVAIINRIPAIEDDEARRSQAPDAATRVIRLGNETLPWARDEAERQPPPADRPRENVSGGDR